MANFPIKCKILITNIHFVMLPIADTNIFADIADIPIADVIIGATLLTMQALMLTQAS